MPNTEYVLLFKGRIITVLRSSRSLESIQKENPEYEVRPLDEVAFEVLKEYTQRG